MEVFSFYYSGPSTEFCIEILSKLEADSNNKGVKTRSNIPVNILMNVAPELYKLANSDSYHFYRNRYQIMSVFGEMIKNHPLSKNFSFPNSILVNDRVPTQVLYDFFEFRNKLNVYSGDIFSLENNTLKYFVLKSNFLKMAFFLPHEFSNNLLEITQNLFEKNITSIDAAAIYYCCFEEDELNEFYACRTRENHTCYLYCQNGEPLLFFIVG